MSEIKGIKKYRYNWRVKVKLRHVVPFVLIKMMLMLALYNFMSMHYWASQSGTNNNSRTQENKLFLSGPIKVRDVVLSTKSRLRYEFAALASPNEGKFLAAANKSCLHEKCLSLIREGHLPRIGILAPPGMIGHYFFLLIKDVLEFADPTVHSRLELVETTRVPPYGYGRNHGMTKIVHILSSWMRVAVADAIYSTEKNNGDNFSDDDMVRPSEEENVAVLKQLVRWHCRLGHVSAHTSLLTVPLADIISDLVGSVSKVLRFIDKDLETNIMEQHKSEENMKFEEKVNAILDEKKLTSVALFENALIDIEEKSIASLLLSPSSSHNIQSDPFDLALKEELEKSNNLKNWPCDSFWNLEISEQTSSAPFLVGDKLIPDCSNEFVTCSINKDKCELKRMSSCA